MRRLIRKLSLLDATDEQTASGKLDLIIQLPYVVKTPARREQANDRRKDIEEQLAGSKYGIAYIDGTEKITQLNRSLENNLLKQIEYLTEMVYSQLGITQEVLNGTADEKTMLNYNNRTVEPFVASIVDEMRRKFLTKTARSQGQTITYFRDPFRLVPINDIAEIADKFTRNEIMTSNEIRQIVGMKPADDPKADELVNSNITQPEQEQYPNVPIVDDKTTKKEKFKMDSFDFSGWATRNDLLCGDGRTIRKDAFKENDGCEVPLIWNHKHDDPNAVLGHAILENRNDGVYAYGKFNDTEQGKHAKKLVDNGDVRSLSIWANQLKQIGGDVVHGNIRELSLVLAGANPGAYVDFVMAHGADEEDTLYASYDENIMLYHSAEVDKKEGEPNMEENKNEDPKNEKNSAGYHRFDDGRAEECDV